MRPDFVDYRVAKEANRCQPTLAEIGRRYQLDVRDAAVAIERGRSVNVPSRSKSTARMRGWQGGTVACCPMLTGSELHWA